MLTIRLEIQKIDYEACVEGLLPALVERCGAKTDPSELEKFVGKLGEDAVPIAKALLGYLDGDTRDGIVVWLLSAHEETLLTSVNRYLEGALSGPILQLKDLVAEDRVGTYLSLRAQAVVDYPALLGSPLVESGIDRYAAQLGREGSLLKGAARFALQVGSRMDPDNLEKQGVALLSSDRVRNQLLALLTEGLRKVGLSITFHDMILETDTAIELPGKGASQKSEGLIPDALEDALMDALVAYLRGR